MDGILTRCGYRCDLCLAYRPRVEKHWSNQQILSEGWSKYFGFRIAAEEILCDGCLSENSSLIDKNCPVRPCVIEKGLEDCSECDLYICEKLKERLVVCEEVKARMGREIPEEEYLMFIRPYENKRRLEALRALMIKKTH